MSDRRRLFQLYLLSQMRNDEAVSKALLVLKSEAAEAAAARDNISASGLAGVGVPLDKYVQTLGEPEARFRFTEARPEEEIGLGFRFEAWPQHYAVLLGSSSGTSGRIRFEHIESASTQLSTTIARLVPWQHVVSDVVTAGWHLTTADDWYPLLDVSAESRDSRERVILQFDFELLQAIRKT